MQTAIDFIKNKKERIQKNLTIAMKDIGRKSKRQYIIESATFLICSDFDKKIFVVERLRILKPTGKMAYKVPWYKGKTEYRIGYYIVGKIRDKKNKWTWGQYCPLISHKDLFNLLKLAKKEGTIKHNN